MSAFGTGLSGLNAASKNLDVVGHNISNANTVGMKAGRAEFSEMFAASFGGANSAGGGIGVSVATVAQQFSQGNLKVTGQTLDLAINGDGFFKLTQKDGSTAYTRNGEFKLDPSGNIVSNAGASLMGYPTDREGVRTGVTTEPMRLPVGGTIPPNQTTNIDISANLDARATIEAGIPAATATATPLTDSQKRYGTAINVFDSLGNAIPVQVYFIKSAANQWQVRVSVDGGDNLLPVTGGSATAGQITFASTAAAGPPPVLVGEPDTGSLPISFDIPQGALTTGIPSTAMTGITIDYGSAGEWNMTQYGSDFTTYDVDQDGYTSGELVSIAFDEKGILTAAYSNGESFAGGQVALTRFRNAQGLINMNGGVWKESTTSGNPIDGAPFEGRFGTIKAGALEESNVDLTAELVNMIVAQRAYQANAQTIKTQDQVLSTLVNLR